MVTRKKVIVSIVLFGCVLMTFVDAIIKPQYIVKSLIKILLFSILPILYAKYDKSLNLKSLFKFNKHGFVIAVLSGISVFTVILGGYFLLEKFFDLTNIVTSLSKNVGVNNKNFVLVAIYISFINSLLEEFFFRGFAFLKLKEISSRKFAYVFSSCIFAFYHVAMMIGWFSLELFVLTLSALFIGGLIFDYFNEKFKNIYISWLIHMFANFATNFIGFILFEII